MYKPSNLNDVIYWYNNIRPMVSKNHTLEDDIRPIGDRKRKWERIVKITANKYALSDGTAWHWYGGGNYEERLVSHFAPITWWRDRKGTEFVRIRNSPYSHASSFCNFMRYYLPEGMHLDNTTLYVHRIPYHLPKPMHAYRFLSHTQYDGTVKPAEHKRLDDKYLVFRKEEGGGYTLVSKKFKKDVQRSKVDKHAKAKHKNDILELRTYIETMSGMFIKPPAHYRSWNDPVYQEELAAYHDTLSEAYKCVIAHGKAHGVLEDNKYFNRDTVIRKPDLVKLCLSDPEHEVYYRFAYITWIQTEGNSVADSDAFKRWRNRFNNHMNKALGLVQTYTTKVDV